MVLINRIVSSPSPDGTEPGVYDIIDRDDGEITYNVESTSLIPDPENDAYGRGDDEAEARYRFQEKDRFFATAREGGLSFALALVGSGEHTSVYDPVGGHMDNFNQTDGKLIENKISCALGDPAEDVRMESYLSEGRVLPGALAYPRYKVATLSYAMSDIELHVLHSAVHMGPRQEDPKYRHYRGAWLRPSGHEPVFYPEGFAVLDWESKYAGN